MTARQSELEAIRYAFRQPPSLSGDMEASQLNQIRAH